MRSSIFYYPTASVMAQKVAGRPSIARTSRPQDLMVSDLTNGSNPGEADGKGGQSLGSAARCLIYWT